MSGAVSVMADAFERLRGVRNALRGIFFLNGVASACWIPLVPHAKLTYGLTDGEAGLALLMAGIGGALSMPLAAFLMLRFGSRTTVAIGCAVSVVTLPLMLQAPTAVLLAIGMLVFGLSRAMQGIAANAQAVIIEARGQRPVMSSFHAYFSLGGLAGALAISGLLKLELSTGATLGVITAVFAWASAPLIFGLLTDDKTSGKKGPMFALPKGAAWLLGFFCFAAYLGEGSVTGWSANFLHFSRGYPVAESGLAFAAFSTTMMIARFTGDATVSRLGRVATLQWGAGLAAAGIALAMLVPLGWVGIAGFALLGLGAGNVVPITFTAAGRLPGLPPSVSIPAVATFGNIALLSGPAFIGFLADAFTLPIALLTTGILYALVALGARRAVR
jgi:fucose permease